MRIGKLADRLTSFVAARRDTLSGWTDFDFTQSAGPQELASEQARSTAALHRRLDAADLAEIARRGQDDQTLIDHPDDSGAPVPTRLVDAWSAISGVDRQRWDLMLGVFLDVPGVVTKTGLTADSPPENVHAMSHSVLATGGSYYHADLVADALGSIGAEPAAGQRGLDFGCSSGRVVRVLKAAYPDTEWFGCDPNAEAIEWAAANVDGVSFEVSPQEPPLPYPDEHLDFAFAISIWSHYSERFARKWYDEMYRVLKPGAHLVVTTHGLQSVAHYAANGMRSAGQLTSIAKSLYSDGYWYAAEFGTHGDWGVVNEDWGTAFVSAEWMLDALAPRWEIVEFARGRNEQNQDVFVLRKR